MPGVLTFAGYAAAAARVETGARVDGEVITGACAIVLTDLPGEAAGVADRGEILHARPGDLIAEVTVGTA